VSINGILNAMTISTSELPGQAPDDLCCGVVALAVTPAEQTERLAGRLKAVGDATRLRLLSMVARASQGEACICDLTEPVGLSQPTVSHHMKILVEAGLLSREQRGRWAYYRLVEGAAEDIAAELMKSLHPRD
jgi:ArsR family transcriptional regulator